MSAIFQNEKIDIQNISFKTNNNFSAKTMIYIYRLSAKFGFDNVFGRSDVTKLQCIETSFKFGPKLISLNLFLVTEKENTNLSIQKNSLLPPSPKRNVVIVDHRLRQRLVSCRIRM